MESNADMTKRLAAAYSIPEERIEQTGEYAFKVTGSKGDIYDVDLKTDICSCKDFVYSGYACKHLLRVIMLVSARRKMLEFSCKRRF